MKKMFVLSKDKIDLHKPKCIFGFYSKDQKKMVQCGKEAVLTYGKKYSDGICPECSQNIASRGVLTEGLDGRTYQSPIEALALSREYEMIGEERYGQKAKSSS